MAQQNAADDARTELTNSSDLATLAEGDDLTVEYTSVQGGEQELTGTVENVTWTLHPEDDDGYACGEAVVDTEDGRRKLTLDATPEGRPMVDVETERRAHDTFTRTGEVTSRTSTWAKIGRSGTVYVAEDDEDEAEYQPQDEVEQEMAEVAAAMGQPEQEAFQEYLAEQREGEDSEDDECEVATDGGLTHEAVEQALDEVLPLLGTYDSLERDLATVAEGRTDQGWIEVRAEASLDLAQEFAAAMREALPGDAYLEVGGMGTFTVVNY